MTLLVSSGLIFQDIPRVWVQLGDYVTGGGMLQFPAMADDLRGLPCLAVQKGSVCPADTKF